MAEEASPDVASWVEIQVTAIFTAATTAIFVVVFEVCRRHPAVLDVFDRRRASKPNRTPPPLLRGRIFEWLFLRTDPSYLEYAYIQNRREILNERKKQHARLYKYEGPDQEKGMEVIEEEPPNVKSETTDTENYDESDEPNMDDEDAKGNLDPSSIDLPVSHEQSDSMEKNKEQSQENSASVIAVQETFEEETATVASTKRTPERKQRSSRRLQTRVSSSRLTPDVVEINGRRLPASIADYAIAGDLTEEQLDKYERDLYEREKMEEEEWLENEEEFSSFSKSPSMSTSLARLFPLPNYFKKETNAQSDRDPTSNKNTTTGFTKSWSSRSQWSSAGSLNSVRSKETIPLTRHLNAAAVTDKRPLSIADEEMLRYVGLDAFVMIRFLRFGFDCTFYPFVAACLILIPTYYTNEYDGTYATEEADAILTNGYFRITMNRLQPTSIRLYTVTAFNFVFFMFILRRLWIEWETFIALRYDFLANGDVESNNITEDSTSAMSQMKRKRTDPDSSETKIDPQIRLQQFRNSCMVEFIPESHRRDQELYEYFDALLPGQVNRAEILLNATQLNKWIKERQSHIEKYEDIYAAHVDARQVYRNKVARVDADENVGVCHYLFCRLCGGAPQKPREPKIRVTEESTDERSCIRKQRSRTVKALPYLLSEIKRLNTAISQEHERILQEKTKNEDKEDPQGFLATSFGQGKKLLTGASMELNCETGFVEFKTLTAAKIAVQCNLTGTSDFMTVLAAPDPRDIIWENAIVDRASISFKKLQCGILLFTGTLFWSVVVTFITSVSQLDKLAPYLPRWMIPEEDSFWYGLLQGYLPVVFLEALMLLQPIVLRFIGINYIRFKSQSEVDQFVFIWHFAYRVANLLIVIVSGSLYETLDSILVSPQAFITTLASGIASQSQFFLNNMIVAAGTETLFELAQIPQMVLHFVIHKIITVDAKSMRALERLEEPPSFEWGEVVPPFIFAFLVATVYCTMVPLVIGVCAVFFFIALKVYVHQALFVYAQPYEGGGKLMYLLNRSVFVILYLAIGIFSTVLGLREAASQAPTFFILATSMTLIVDLNIQKKFVKPSATLALANARMVDEENKKKAERMERYQQYIEAKRQVNSKNKKKQVIPTFEEEDTTETNVVHTPQQKRIVFRVAKEIDPKTLEKREEEKRSKLSAGAAQLGFSWSSRDDGRNPFQRSRNSDFYLFRQPSLNKSLWETKPRPYR